MTTVRPRDNLTMTATPKVTTNGDAPITTRLDFLKVRDLIAHGARVLDVGCADGELLALLAATRSVDGRGIELSQAGVNAAVGRGLAVVQGDADSDLDHYTDDTFDYVVLSQTLQATRNPRRVLENMLRIGHHACLLYTSPSPRD